MQGVLRVVGVLDALGLGSLLLQSLLQCIHCLLACRHLVWGSGSGIEGLGIVVPPPSLPPPAPPRVEG